MKAPSWKGTVSVNHNVYVVEYYAAFACHHLDPPEDGEFVICSKNGKHVEEDSLPESEYLSVFNAAGCIYAAHQADAADAYAEAIAESQRLGDEFQLCR